MPKCVLCFILSLCSWHNALAHTFYIAKHNALILTQALQTARDGDTVVLRGGTYRGHWKIKCALSMIGQQHAILSADNTSVLLTISAAGVTLKHLNFQAPLKSSITLIEAKNTHDLTLKSNYFYGGREAIYLSKVSHVSLLNNHFRQVYFGIHTMASTSCQIKNNSITHSGVGMALMNSSHLLIKHNYANTNHLYGFLLRELSYSQFIGNKALHNKSGLMLSGSFSNILTDNLIAYNDYGLVLSFGSTANRIYNNDFVKNRLQVRYANMGSTHVGYKGRGNYWSNYHNFSPLQKDVGSAPFYVTNLAGWLSFSFPTLNIMFDSPAMHVLEKVENNFPVLRQAGLVDDYPLTYRVTHDE